jgi:hypothetical protein
MAWCLFATNLETAETMEGVALNMCAPYFYPTSAPECTVMNHQQDRATIFQVPVFQNLQGFHIAVIGGLVAENWEDNWGEGNWGQPQRFPAIIISGCPQFFSALSWPGG